MHRTTRRSSRRMHGAPTSPPCRHLPLQQQNSFQSLAQVLHQPGIEPGSGAWETPMIAITPLMRKGVCFGTVEAMRAATGAHVHTPGSDYNCIEIIMTVRMVRVSAQTAAALQSYGRKTSLLGPPAILPASNLPIPRVTTPPGRRMRKCQMLACSPRRDTGDRGATRCHHCAARAAPCLDDGPV